GAPGDQLCSQCHGGSSGGTGSVSVSIAGNPTEYVPGMVYSVTVDVVDPVANEFGFQMTCINGTSSASDSPNTGGFSAGTGTWLQTNNGRQYITHNTPSSTGSWTFDWTAPNPADGDLHFYIASLGTNNNNSTSGDKLYTTTLTLNAPAAACAITNLTTTAQACDGNGNFDVVIDFDVSDVGANNTFTIEGNSTNYGTFNYNNLPITLSDLDGDNTTIYAFTVTDTNDANCTTINTLGMVDCPSCVISNLTATAQACQIDGAFDVVIDFDVANGGANNTFTIAGNSTNYGTFNYNNLPITIADLDGDNSTNYDFTVTDTNFSNCNANVNLGVVDCPVCSITNLTSTAQACEADGTFDVIIDFDVVDAGGTMFSVQGNGNTYGLFSYASLPITIVDLEGDNSTDYEFIVTDNTIASCSASTNLGLIGCPVCSINDLVVTQGDCQTDGTFSVTIDFNAVNPVSSSFSIAGNGNDYGSFLYANLPIIIENLVGDNSTDYEFEVTDNDLLTCSASANLGVVNCPVCSINDLVVTQGDCQADGTFSVTIDFNAVNPASSSFTIEGNGTNYGSFQYANLPIT
ncbi:MAG: choice-of-anchor V domain-containing protein, partial [Chitinophagales bacterium]